MQLETLKIEKQTKLFDDKIQDVVMFLEDNYDIRIPVHDPSKVQITCKDPNRYAFAPSLDDISLHLISEGKNIGDAILRKIIRSPNYLKPCNPVREYFDSVRGKWSGESEIDRFCQYIKPRIFDDNTAEHYRQRADKLIKKWMVACVACWLGNKHNDVALGFVSIREGVGKTHLVKFLIPKCISEYYVESSSDERKFDVEDVFTRYMLINFDELVGLNKSNFEIFKKCLSADQILNKRRHEEFPTMKPRIGCATFTSNFNEERGGFISEYWGTENRRIGAIEIVDIDRAYSSLVDVDQMWSEALSLYENTQFDYDFSQPDYEDFAIYNSRYVIESEAMKIIQIHMAIPATDEEGEKLNPTAILQRLTKNPKIKSDDLKKVNAQKIGAALTLLGFQKVSYRPSGSATPLKGYCVKFLE